MINIKKLISFVVSLAFSFNILMPLSTFSLKRCNYCSQVDDPDVYCCDHNCGEIDKESIFNSGKDYIFISNPGNSSVVHHFFSLKNPDRIFNKLKIEPTNQLREEWDSLCKQEDYYSNSNNFIKVLFTSLVGGLSGHLFKSLTSKEKKAYNRPPAKRSCLFNMAHLIGGAVFGISSFIYLNIKKDKVSESCKEAYKKYDSANNLNKKKKNILNSMVRSLKNENPYGCIVNDGDDIFFFDLSLDSIPTEEEKTNLKDFSEKIIQHLKENDMFDEETEID